jgi:hypothetical protein
MIVIPSIESNREICGRCQKRERGSEEEGRCGHPTLQALVAWCPGTRVTLELGVRCFDILLESPCGEVIFLSTAVGCFHPCQMAITQTVLHRKVRPCYTHYGNVNLDLNNIPRKWRVIAMWSPCVNILSVYTMCSFFNVMDNFRNKRRSRAKWFHSVDYRNSSTIVVSESAIFNSTLKKL